MPRRKVTEEDKLYMQRLYSEGLSLDDVSYITGFATTTVATYVTPRYGHMDQKEKNDIVELFHKDWTIGEIASAVCRSKSTVNKYLHSIGLRRYRKYDTSDHDSIVKHWNELGNKSAVARIIGCERKKVTRVLKERGLQ